MDDTDFRELLTACQEIAITFSEGVIFIGGIAVYLHAINGDSTSGLAEFTHDGDFYISLADMADLRDIEQVTANRRLSKHQLIKRGFEFDIYTERQSSLIVPYDQVAAYSETFDELRVACLEHLLVLKLEAYRDRRNSSKGQKDSKDIIRLCLVFAEKPEGMRIELCEGYLGPEHIALLKGIQAGPEFLSLTRGNAKEAKTLRGRCAGVLARLVAG